MVMEDQFPNPLNPSILLEHAANDDLRSFKLSVESSNLPIDCSSLWYSRRLASRSMSYEQRTPLMIAALYGSTTVLRYILSTPRYSSPYQVNRASGSDRATALHLAVFGGAVTSPLAVEILLAASADPNSLDSNGRRPSDLIPNPSPKSRSDISRKLRVLFNCPITSTADLPETEPSSPEKRDAFSSSSPLAVSMPDINAGMYGSDEFRMYGFKIKPCSRAYTHDWTECPFAHPGENARRRDPRRHSYSCVPCPEFKKGSCRKGEDCEYAHGVFESWLHPAQYKTRLCKDEAGCTRKVCFFAHKKEELRPVYASTGSAIPSSMESGMFQTTTTSTPPASPSLVPSSSPKWSGGKVGNGNCRSPNPLPSLQLSGGSRLRSSLSARDMDLGMEIFRLENQIAQQQKQMDEVYGGRIGDLSNLKPANLDSVFGSVMGGGCSSPLSPMKDANQLRQNMNHLRSSYPVPQSRKLSPTELDCSPPRSSSVATAMLNSRAAAASAFVKRSQSFIDRGAINHVNSGSRYGMMGGSPSPLREANSDPWMSNWGPVDGKPDWSVQGEDLSKLRRSASFGYRGGVNTAGNGGGGGGMRAGPFEGSRMNEPDVSWVNSLVRDVPASGGVGHELRSPWVDQLYIEQQEQMVA